MPPDDTKSPLNQPSMTVMAGRPTKVLHTPDRDILVSCRTASGEDVYVPLTALFVLFEQGMTSKMRAQGGQAHGSH